MKILVIADRNPKIDVIETVKSANINLIVTLGDLTSADIYQLEYITDIPKIGVYGNHDGGGYMKSLGIWDMHLKTWQFGDRSFGGFQGCVRYKENPDAIMCTQALAA